MLGNENATKKTTTVTNKGKVIETSVGVDEVCTAVLSEIYLSLITYA